MATVVTVATAAMLHLLTPAMEFPKWFPQLLLLPLFTEDMDMVCSFFIDNFKMKMRYEFDMVSSCAMHSVVSEWYMVVIFI